MKRMLMTAPAMMIALALAAAADAATVKGTLTDESGKPLSGAQVTVPALNKGAATGADGAFSLDVPDGEYVLQFKRQDYATETRKVTAGAAGASVSVSMHQTPIEIAPITITAAAAPSDASRTPASVSVVEGRKLDKVRSQSVIAAIQDQPGVSMIQEGPTIVKPVIRGLNSQDVVVVEDGIRSEALQWGNEHAPEIDPMNTSRIEVMRGANSLLYGSDALGGVISISHPDLPDAKLGDGPLQGRVMADVQSVNRSAGQGALLSGAQGDWGWRADISQRQSGNFMTPHGEVPNTGDQEVAGSGSVGVRKDWGSVTADYGRFDKRIELQNGNVFPNQPLGDTEFQVLHHDKGSIRANLPTPVARFELTAGYDRSNRNEYDSPAAPDQIAHLHWIQTNFTGDAKAHLEPMGPFNGTIGVTGTRRVEQSIGAVHLTPGYNENSVGEYLFEQAAFGPLDVTAGVRGDQSSYGIGADNRIGIDPSHSLNSPHPVAKQQLNYTAVSGALGGVYHVTEKLSFAANVSRGYRNPVPFELFAFGVHEGGGVFQIGNPGLKPETSFNTDAAVRWASERLKAEAGVFRNRLHDYIYGSYTGAIDAGSGLPVVTEKQSDATIQGFDFAVTGAATDWLTLKAVGNLVRGYNDTYDVGTPNRNIPHVPADNLLVGFELHRREMGSLRSPYFSVESKMYRPQRRTGPEEIATPGYALFGLKTGTEIVLMNNRLSVDAGVDNLLNKGYIDYNSILKEFNIENPGRNVYARVSVPFGS